MSDVWLLVVVLASMAAGGVAAWPLALWWARHAGVYLVLVDSEGCELTARAPVRLDRQGRNAGPVNLRVVRDGHVAGSALVLGEWVLPGRGHVQLSPGPQVELGAVVVFATGTVVAQDRS